MVEEANSFILRWKWPEIRDLLVQTNTTTFAIQQCHFGADTPEPSRFLTTLFTDDPRCYFGWSQFSTNAYCGPLPKSCGHVHQQKLIGQQDGKWKTGPTWTLSIYCKCLAASPLVGRGKDDTSTSTAVATPTSTPLVGKNPLCALNGTSRIGNVDGFGLCSPCRWHPWNRGMNRPQSSKQLAIDTCNLLESVVVAELADVRAYVLQIGCWEVRVFALSAALDRTRERLAELVGAPDTALLVDEG